MSEEKSEIVQQVEELADQCKKHEKQLNDLIEYLQRTDDNFKNDPATFNNWGDRLDELRRRELVDKDIHKAKGFLQSHGYIVAADESEIDAQKLRQWLSKK